MRKLILLGLSLILVTSLAACDGETTSGGAGGDNRQPSGEQQPAGGQLPDLASFATTKSDQLPIDITNVYAIAPYLGADSAMPHQGMHFNFHGDGAFATELQPAKYPAVYAVTDGTVERVDAVFHNGDADRYGVSIAFASQGGHSATMNYSLEPFIREPSPGFYAQFITVAQGQTVKKGDVLGFLYVPPGLTQGPHLHLDVTVGQSRFAPAVFSPQVVDEMHAKFGEPSGMENGAQLPACVGYKVSAVENPFTAAAQECLN